MNRTFLSLSLSFPGLLFFATGTRAAAEEELPDSLLTEDYLYEYTFTDSGKAQRIIERMRERKNWNLPDSILPKAIFISKRGDIIRDYVNYALALESRTVQGNDTEYMDVLHRKTTGRRSISNRCSQKPTKATTTRWNPSHCSTWARCSIIRRTKCGDTP